MYPLSLFNWSLFSEACGEDGKACNTMCQGPSWIAISCAAARATASNHGEPYSLDNVDHGPQVIPVSGGVFWYAASIPTRPTASSIHSPSGRAVEQTATLLVGSAIAKCGQGAAWQLLCDFCPRSRLIPCKSIDNCTWFRHASAIF